MRKIKIIIVLLLLIFKVDLALAMTKQEAITNFVMAAEAYKLGDYEDSINLYEEIIDGGLESGAVYYNLANSYYKQKNIGMAMLNYERARRLIPRDSDLRFNYKHIKSAQPMLDDPQNNGFPYALMDKHINFYTLDEMVLLITILVIVIGVFFLMSRFFNWSKYSKLVTRMIPTALLLVFVIGFVMKFQMLKGSAIVVTSASARFEPLDDSTVHFELMEGKKVKILKVKDGWFKIQRADNKLGWVKKDAVEKI